VAAFRRAALKPNPEQTDDPHTMPDAALKVPVMCNLGTKEGVTVKDGRFAGVWPAWKRSSPSAWPRRPHRRGRRSADSHECGNQRYFAIPWLDACLSARLPKTSGDPLNDMPTDGAWLAP
jgi:hypothetical protein